MVFSGSSGAREGSPHCQKVDGRDEQKQEQPIEETFENETGKVGGKNSNVRHRVRERMYT